MNYARNTSEAELLTNQCKTVQSGLLNLGVSSTISSMYLDIEQANIFYVTLNRTAKNLQSILYD